LALQAKPLFPFIDRLTATFLIRHYLMDDLEAELELSAEELAFWRDFAKWFRTKYGGLAFEHLQITGGFEMNAKNELFYVACLVAPLLIAAAYTNLVA
jgi:hypothetical protein